MSGKPAGGRCPWPGTDPLYVAYHDDEWGVPERDDRALYEKLVLDGFQAGLSWITILRKQDAGIVRNRMKIEGAVASARSWLEIMENGAGFSPFLWEFVDGKPIVNRYKTMSEIPAETEISRIISKELKAQGFKFCGPTIIYAFMQATGMVNDHLTSCPRHAACVKLDRTPSNP
jgi:DNA-3-methyladenine glycosylase I